MASGIHRRFERNAPGPFYTTGVCAACGAPEDAAPDLLAPLDDDNPIEVIAEFRNPSAPSLAPTS